MLSEAPTVPSSDGPITRLPYDILHEIFAHCLPQYPLDRRQPDTTIAPMLLCHICSSWRRLTLASATLWSHLSYRFPIIGKYDYNSMSVSSWIFKFAERDIEFIRWWKRNQGQIAPFLYFDVGSFHRGDRTQELAGTNAAFFLEYLNSAQYLKLDVSYWYWIRKRLQAGNRVVFPNLHTVLTEHICRRENPFYEFQTPLPHHTVPALRRLSISEPPSPHAFTTPQYWSSLTHLSLEISISLNFWFSVIRAVPHLLWGYFDITMQPSGINANHTSPSQCTLLYLTTLSVGVRSRLERNSVFPLSIMFTDLHLPALRTLSLCTPGAKAWEDRRALYELYTVLRSTPAVRNLTLEKENVYINGHAHIPPTILSAIPDAEPIWIHVKELTHLQLAFPADSPMSESQCEECLVLFVRYIFSTDSLWLDLQNPTSPIRAVTLSNNRAIQAVSELTMGVIREISGKAPKVVFKMTMELAGEHAVYVRNGWGSRR